MANRFWVGGGSANTWAATANTNWAATSGGANNQTVPGASDIAIFDSNSGVGNSVIGANITVQGLDCTGGTGNYAGTITHNTSVTLTINTGAASSLRFSSAMTYTPASTTSIITFTHTSGTAQITSAGKRFFAITINGAGGTTQLQDAFRCDAGASAIVTNTTGVFDANNQTVTIGILSSSNSNTRTITMGSGLWVIGAGLTLGTTIWNLGTTTGLTFNKNTANIQVSSSANATATRTFAGGALTYNDLTIDQNTSGGIFKITGANTFAHVVLSGAPIVVQFPNGATTTISNAFSWSGTSAQNNLFESDTIGLPATISVPSGTSTITWAMLRDLTFTGGGAFTATNSFDGKDNSGITIAAPLDSALTPATIASAIWQDTTAGDFTVAASVGKSVMNGVSLGTGLTVNDITTKTGYSLSGTQTFNVTGNITGNLTGSVGSVSGLTASNLDATVSSRLASASYTAPDSAATIAAAVLASTIETGMSLLQYFRLAGAVLLGKLSGAATTTNTFRNAVADSKARVTATVDSDGNRSAITYDAS